MHRYTVLGNGLNRLDAGGRWVECTPAVRSYSAGIICTGATYQVIFNNNLNRAGSVDFETSDQQRILSNPLALAYYDPESGRREWIAQIKDCQAAVNGNKVVYADAFAGKGIEASVVYTYGVGRFHQDVVFTRQPGVTPSNLGMGSRTRLEVVTEILQSPVPTKKLRILKREKNPLVRSRMVEPDLTDETLNFTKEMGMPLGHVIMNDTVHPDRQLRVPVAKRLRTLPDGRTVLFESTEWSDIRVGLEKLPRFAVSSPTSSNDARLARAMPASPPGVKTGETFDTHLADVRTMSDVRLAMAAVVPTGMVVDYTILQHSFSTYFPEGTYLIPDDENAELEGPCEFSGTCIFKFGRNGYLWIDSWDPYAGPDLIFTALDDDSVGEVIPGSTGQPTGYYGWLEADFPTEPLPDFWSVDFRYMYQAMLIYAWDSDLTLQFSDNVYLRHCDVGFDISGNDNLTLNVAHPYTCDVQTYMITGDNTYYSPYDPPSAGDCDGDYDNDGLDDGWEVRHFGNTSQTPSGDFDNDGLSNLQEYQLGSDPTTTDSDGDGLPDGWEYHWFGNFTHTGDELDASGNTLLSDYQNNLDPNVIKFSIAAANDYINTTTVSAQLDITAGTPSYYAVLINDTNLANANWQSFAGTNLTLNLGSTDGTYDVTIGLKGLAAEATETWQYYAFYLDRIAPTVTITNPVLEDVAGTATATVVKPYLQLQGLADEPLASLSYDISNANDLFTNQNAFVTDQYFDTNKFNFTTNYFQAYDVPLTQNENIITMRLIDRAGNITVTNFTVTLDYSGATAPEVQLIWPQDGMAVSGANITIRGTMSDETRTIQATVVNGDETTSVIQGLVERNHMFWIEGVPLNGINQITLQATDASGNHVATTNFTVNPSDIVLTIDSTPTGEDLYKPTGNVSGTVSDPNATVTVNEAEATVENEANGSGTYNWSASNVPNFGQGTATFTAMAAVPGNPTTFSAVNQEKPPYVTVVEYRYKRNEATTTSNPDGGCLWTWNWDKGCHATFQTSDIPSFQDGWATDKYKVIDHNPLGTYTYEGTLEYVWSDNVDGYVTVNNIVLGVLVDDLIYSQDDYEYRYPWEAPYLYSDWQDGFYYADTSYYWGGVANLGGVNHTYGRLLRLDVKTQVKLWTGGKSGVNRKSLFDLQCTATELKQPPVGYLWEPWPERMFPYPTDLAEQWQDQPSAPITPTKLEVLGKSVGADGRLWVALPDNTPQDITVTAKGFKHYDAWATAQKYRLLIQANSALLQPDRVTAYANFCVGQHIGFSPAWSPSTPPFTDAVAHWTLPGTFVNTNPFPACPTFYNKNPAFLNKILSVDANLSTACWYVTDFQAQSASQAMNLFFPNGQTVFVNASGQLNMFRPKMGWDGDDSGSVAVDTFYEYSGWPGSTFYLHFGFFNVADSSSQHPGIKFHRDVDEPWVGGGTYLTVQLFISTSTDFYGINGIVDHYSGSGLDTGIDALALVHSPMLDYYYDDPGSECSSSN